MDKQLAPKIDPKLINDECKIPSKPAQNIYLKVVLFAQFIISGHFAPFIAFLHYKNALFLPNPGKAGFCPYFVLFSPIKVHIFVVDFAIENIFGGAKYVFDSKIGPKNIVKIKGLMACFGLGLIFNSTNERLKHL